MRVGIVALIHESNTFISRPTTWEHFQEHALWTGDDIRRHLAEAPHEVGGFFAGLYAAGLTAVPLLFARALPYGPITIACALVGIRFRQFAIGSLLGDLPVAALYAFAGSRLMLLASTDEAISPVTIAALVAAGVAALVAALSWPTDRTA